MSQELAQKLARIDNLLEENQLDALLVQRVDNFAWLTNGGASYINAADVQGVGSLLITPSGRYLVTNNIEEPRFRNEENLEGLDWEFEISPWYQVDETVSALTRGLRLATDGLYPEGADVSEALRLLRMDLLPPEQARFREVSLGCAEAMDAAIRQVAPGMTEYEIAGLLGREVRAREVLPVVILIATDERIFNYRHPLPTARHLERYAMLVLCGRKHGLVASMTRLVHFGALPGELRRKQDALAQVDAAFITATRPGSTLGQVLGTGQARYAEVGFAEEWQLHHQGGPAGYLPREFIATPGNTLAIRSGQVYAWNPSITGTKSEDTILVGPQGSEVLTRIAGWPMVPAEVDGEELPRPAILEIL